MKSLVLLIFLAAAVASMTALGESRDFPLVDKIHHCAVVAEVRIENIRLQRDSADKFEDLVCECSVLHGFKLPVATNRLTLRLNFAASRSKYEQKTALIFAVEQDGHFSPFGGDAGIVLETQAYVDRYSHKELKYVELIRQVKSITQANQPMQPTPR